LSYTRNSSNRLGRRRRKIYWPIALFPSDNKRNSDTPSSAHLFSNYGSCLLFYGNAWVLISGYRDHLNFVLDTVQSQILALDPLAYNITAFCDENGNDNSCLASKSLRRFAEGDPAERMPGFKEMPWNYLKFPGNRRSYLESRSGMASQNDL
jgi:hypothetical protein